MTTEVSPASRGAKREPVFQGKQRVPGLWVRETKSGPVFEVQKRVDGRMRRIKLGAQNKTDAINEARTLAVDVDRGDVRLGDRTLTLTALRNSYLARERGVLGTRSKRTVELHQQQLRDHVLPLLGAQTKAVDVQSAHLRKLIDTLNARGLSGSTVRGCVSATSAMFRHGVRDLGALPRNPVRDLDRGDRPSGKRLSEPRYLSVEEVEALLAKLSEKSRPVVAALFYAALRVGEALTLTWADIDFDAATIQVRGTKTKASAAAVPLLPRLAAELRAHRALQATLGFERVKPEAFVFATRSGRSPSRRNVLRAVQNAATAAGLNAEGLPPVGLHDLRHSLAASAFALGLTAPEVARLLRHAGTQVTLSVYSGISDTAAAAIGTKLAALGERL